eukprot:CAMPEP_0171456710 /NCGR_PEP_ID=MMETSP0945-20130129/3081_1 /TAXON_ID=109269 /ORGANISM="Vaucheria litorea, Strain CCMP2940" /LENGTH=496 /DNA_ID=CAMNT_0011982175 /DNA_START=557 /DNA_END=2045 /DNA_ORIENTATION=+
MSSTFDLDPDEVIPVSAKSGEGIDEIIDSSSGRFPPPPPDKYTLDMPMRARILDSWYDHLRGVICLIQCVNGQISENDRITTTYLISKFDDGLNIDLGNSKSNSDITFSVQELGILSPTPLRTKTLYPGQVGFMVGGIKNVRQVLLGDTIVHAKTRKNLLTKEENEIGGYPSPLPLFSPCLPNLFASCFPMDGVEYMALATAIEKLALNDASLQVQKESSTVLGHGLRVGFLGLLHMEVFKQRLEDEFGISALITAPNVPYIFRNVQTKNEIEVVNLSDWANLKEKVGSRKSRIEILEPMVEATIITPAECLGSLMTLLKEKRGTEIETRYIDQERLLMIYKLPWQEVVTDLHDKAKSLSSGYASMNYKSIKPEPADLVLCDMKINGDKVDSISFVCHKANYERQGRDLAKRLKMVIPRQQFEVNIQACLGTKSFAKERIPPYRKDVLTKSGKTVGGGDPSRKKKLLDKQKEGKKRAKTVGKIELPQSAFWALISK